MVEILQNIAAHLDSNLSGWITEYFYHCDIEEGEDDSTFVKAWIPNGGALVLPDDRKTPYFYLRYNGSESNESDPLFSANRMMDITRPIRLVLHYRHDRDARIQEEMKRTLQEILSAYEYTGTAAQIVQIGITAANTNRWSVLREESTREGTKLQDEDWLLSVDFDLTYKYNPGCITANPKIPGLQTNVS